MNVSKLPLISVGVMLLVGGFTAIGAASPTDPTSSTEDTHSTVGPGDGLPEPAADSVADLLGTIGEFVDGTVDTLGASVRSNLSSAAGVADELVVDSSSSEALHSGSNQNQ